MELTSENELLGGIYLITNTQNGRVYLGSTYRFKQRRAAHFWMLNKGVHYNNFLQADFNKCGQNVFTFTILEIVESGNKEEILVREDALLKSVFDNGRQCYNFLNTARGNRRNRKDTEPGRRKQRGPWSEETRAKYMKYLEKKSPEHEALRKERIRAGMAAISHLAFPQKAHSRPLTEGHRAVLHAARDKAHTKRKITRRLHLAIKKIEDTAGTCHFCNKEKLCMAVTVETLSVYFCSDCLFIRSVLLEEQAATDSRHVDDNSAKGGE